MPYIVRCFPHDDPDLLTLVNAELAAFQHGRQDHDGVVAGLADALRPTHPKIVVHRSEEMATLPGQTMLYVYRDGSPLPR